MAIASPTNKNSTHHIVLSHEGSELGLILVDGNGDENAKAWQRNPAPESSLQMRQGRATHGDLEPTLGIQDDWGGGMGSKWFDRDKTKFSDGEHIFTLGDNKIILGGMEQFCTGYRVQNMNWPRHGASGGPVTYYWQNLQGGGGGVYLLAVSFIPTSNYTAKKAWLFTKGNLDGVTVMLCGDNGGDPDYGSPLVIAGDARYASPSGLIVIDLDTGAALTSGTTYWMVMIGTAEPGATNYILCHPETSGAKTAPQAGTPWTSINYKPFFRVTDADATAIPLIFEYKGALLAVFGYDDGSTPKLFILGDWGVATGAQTSTTLKDTTKTGATAWTTDEHKGKIVRINSGIGSQQRRKWRLITGNTSDTLSIAAGDAWDITPAAGAGGSEYSILCSEKLREITGHGLTGPITDVLDANGYVYIAQGDGVNIRRMEAYNNAGTWTLRYADDGAAGTFLCAAADMVGPAIWRALRGTATVYRAAAVTTWIGLTWGSAIQCGDNVDEITNLIQYGTYGNVWVLKAGEFGMIIDNKYYTVPLQEMKNASDDRNGAAAIMHNLYLYFSLHNGLERYFENSLDGMGPEKLDDVPTWRKGPIIDLAGYPGWLFAAIDSTSLYSYTRKGSILVWNGRGWHPFYICPKGLYTNSIKAQSTPGDNVDRLWVSVGGDILWLPISFDPTRDQDVSYNFFTHAPTGYLVTGRIFTEVMDTEKFFEALKLNLENINTGLEWVEAEYRIDDTPIWTLIGSYTAEPFEEKSISASNDKTGRWIQQRITLNTAYNNTTPRVWAMILKGLVKYPIEYLITLNFRVATSDRDMNGDPDPQTVAQKFALLDVWEAQAAPVSMSSVITRLNGKYVHIDPGSQRIVRYTLKDDGIERYISQVRLKEV